MNEDRIEDISKYFIQQKRIFNEMVRSTQEGRHASLKKKDKDIIKNCKKEFGGFYTPLGNQ